MGPIGISPAAPTIPAALLLPAERDEREVRCGPWALRSAEGRLDEIRFEGARILRGVRFVVRDRDWGTFATTRADLRAEEDELVIEGMSEGGGARVEWILRARFEESTLMLALEARAATALLRNRLGLVVLHPADAAGAPLEVLRTDGSLEQTRFPARIAPHQPARDIAGLAWTASGVAVTAAFDGDVFEMEDQRNWTDASFKTYSTPLDRPFPVAVAEGEVVRQSVRIECSGTPTPAKAEPDGLRLALAGHAFPEILTGASSAPSAARPAESWIGRVGLLVECDPRWAGWRRALARALEDAQERSIDLRIVAAEPDDVARVLGAVGDAPLARLGVYAAHGHRSTPELLDAARRAVGGTGAEVLGGVRSHFTELNRGAQELAVVDAPLALSLTAFMHDTSGHQLVESLGTQRAVVRDALAIADGRRLRIGPVTLGARMNAVSTSPFDPGDADIDAHGYGPQHLPGATDPRQSSPALAAWVVGSVAALAQPGVDSLAYFEEWGPRGASGTPAGRVLEWAAEIGGGEVVTVDAAPLPLVAIGVQREGEQLLLVGNLGATGIEPSWDGVHEWRRSLDGSLGVGPLRLAPGEAARVVRRAQPSGV
ncbi:hypothetical protein [Rathayibacter sp. SD072]|uniref:hypothetical protein n=1 Tax=Rathayibacter sp. SD072 TaxID=2781731 RepID=UPI001A9582A6|nr:hypothetical protein [Rathayibacter sp. SD072]MBO0984704.1 hypothetical protein [Rathayibacter sp. SD072]